MPKSDELQKTVRYGEGSIYKRKDGYWVAKYFPKPGAKAKYLYGKNETEVKRKLRELKQNPELLLQTAPIQTTVEEYITNWLDTYKRTTVKQSTYDRLEVILRKQIAPYIGIVQIGNITSDDCQNLLTTLIEEGLSYTVVKKAYDILNGCFLHATIKGDIPSNPMLLVHGPVASKFETKDVRWLTVDEEHILFAELYKDWTTGTPKYCYRDVFELMLNTGLREGEMVALDWSDIDFENRTMKVYKTAIVVRKRSKDGKLTGEYQQAIQNTPKTKSGNRVIPLNNNAINALRRLREAFPESSTVMTTKTGARPNVTVLQKQLKRASDRCKIYGVSPHTLRHTFATRLFEKGADVKTVSVLLGHSSVTITYNTYIHVIQEKKMDIVELLDK